MASSLRCICKLQPVRRLNSSKVLPAVQAAVQLSDPCALAVLLQLLPGTRQLEAGSVLPLLQCAVQLPQGAVAGAVGAAGQLMADICGLPGTQQLEAVAVFSLIESALLSSKGRHIRPLLLLPGFQQLPPAQVQQLLLKALQQGGAESSLHFPYIDRVLWMHDRDVQQVNTAVGLLCDSRHVQRVLTQPQMKQAGLDSLLFEAYCCLDDTLTLARHNGHWQADTEARVAAGCVDAAGRYEPESAANVSRLFGLLRLGGATLKGAELSSAWL